MIITDLPQWVRGRIALASVDLLLSELCPPAILERATQAWEAVLRGEFDPSWGIEPGPTPDQRLHALKRIIDDGAAEICRHENGIDILTLLYMLGRVVGPHWFGYTNGVMRDEERDVYYMLLPRLPQKMQLVCEYAEAFNFEPWYRVSKMAELLSVPVS